MPETITTTMGQSDPSYNVAMALIAASRGNKAGFFWEHAGRKGVFQDNIEDGK